MYTGTAWCRCGTQSNVYPWHYDSSNTVHLISLLRHFQTEVNFDAQRLSFKNTCKHWAGVSDVPHKQLRKYQTTMNKSCQTHSFTKPALFVTMLYLHLFKPIQTKPRQSTRWVTRRHGILLVQSKSQLLGWRRRELSLLSWQSLQVVNCYLCRQSSSGRQWPPAHTQVQHITRKPRNLV